MQQTQKLLYYIATQEEAVLTFNVSDMKLAAHSNASYLSEPKACSLHDALPISGVPPISPFLDKKGKKSIQ